MLRRIVLALLLVTISHLGFGQAPTDIKPSNDTGLKPLTPYATGDGNVNLTNGNLNFQIPIITLPGRNGLNYPFALVYDSKIWSPHPSYASPTDVLYTWTIDRPTQTAVGDFGWHLNFPSLTNGPWLTDANGYHIGNGDYIVTDWDGSKHALGRTGYSIFTDWSKNAEDGSGFTIDESNGNHIVYDKNGTAYFGPRGIEDTNGNYIGSTDTLGRTVTVGGGLTPTTVSYKDSSGTTRTWTFHYTTITFLTGFVWGQTFPFTYPAVKHCSKSGNNCINVDVVQPIDIPHSVLTSVTLPDNTSYTFSYNNYGELATVTYPTGGYVKYEYAPYVHTETWWNYTIASCAVEGCAKVDILSDFREVNKKRVCSANVGVGGTCPSEDITVYDPGTSVYATSNWKDDVYEGVPSGDTFVPPHSYLRRKVQYYWTCDDQDPDSSRYCSPKDGGQDVYDSNGTVLKSTRITYSTYNRSPLFPTTITTSYNGGPVSTEQLTYDSLTAHVLQPCCVDFSQQTLQDVSIPIDNVTERKIFDYGQTTTPLRREENTYLKYSQYSYQSPHILDRKLEQQIYDGNNLLADTKYEYDNPLDGTVASGAVNHEGNGGLGNVSAIKRWRSTDNTWLPTYYRKYDDAGNVLLVQDPLGHQTQLFYDDAWGDSTCAPTGGSAKAYLTKVITPAGITTQGTYDSCTGKVASIIDPNSQVVSFTYDLFGRTLTALSPLNGSITFGYPNPNTVNRSQAITASLALNHTITFDGRGRIITTALTSDPQGTTYSDTTYDAVGRVQTVSNPYRTGDTKYYTTTAYDALDRVMTVTQPDNSTAQTAFSMNTTAYTTTVTDEAGKQRKTASDALGRLTQVLEPDGTGGLNWQTNYFYDALGNLLCVEQRGTVASATGCSTPDYYGGDWRVRRFYYDSLSHLTQAKNPESNSILYAYDDDGQVKTKTDANGSATAFSYVNDRITTKVYTPGAGVAATPQVSYTYDSTAGGNFGLGRRTGMTDGSGSTSWVYDAKGRVSQIGQTINTRNKTISYGYNYDDSVASIAYPSGRTVTYTPSAAGRMLSAIDQNGTPGVTTDDINYVTGATYAAHGALAGMVNGSASGFAGITITNRYNPRLQPLLLSAASPSATLLSLCYDFHLKVAFTDATCPLTASTGDNGNVIQIKNNRDTNRTQNFLYDNLNRISQAYTTGSNWGETFSPTVSSPGVQPSTPGIDAWGNLTNRSGVTGKTYTEGLSCPANTKNQLTTCSMGYDTAGNMTSNGTATYTYDAENRLATAGGVTYTYDGDGKRVKKSNGKLYWTGVGSDPLTETNLSGTPTADYIFFDGKRVARRDLPSGTVHYYFSDHLGSASVVTDAVGTLSTREESDYYPYGGEMVIANGDTNNYKFTGKERDSESGLDNFGARYNASSLGRFMTPDPLHILKQKLVDPQQWNMYSFVRNNPLRFVDPTGKALELTGDDAERTRKLDAYKAAVGAKAGASLYDNLYKGKHYLGVRGKMEDFKSANSIANKLGGIIADQRVAVVSLVPEGTQKAGGHVLGSVDKGLEPAATYAGPGGATTYATSGDLGSLPAKLSDSGKAVPLTLGEVLIHEIGEVDAQWYHGADQRKGDGVRIENEMRRRDGAPTRNGHDIPYDVPLDHYPY